MNIEFSQHSKERLKQRRISQKKVIQTVLNADEVSLSSRERKLSRKRFSDKILEVVTKNEVGKIVIITSYYLKE